MAAAAGLAVAAELAVQGVRLAVRAESGTPLGGRARVPAPAPVTRRFLRTLSGLFCVSARVRP